MISFGNAASSHSGLIPLKTAYKKRGELLWAIASQKNFINLHSAAFAAVFASNLVHAYKFRIIQKRLDKFFYTLDNLEINHQKNIPCKFPPSAIPNFIFVSLLFVYRLYFQVCACALAGSQLHSNRNKSRSLIG